MNTKSLLSGFLWSSIVVILLSLVLYLLIPYSAGAAMVDQWQPVDGPYQGEITSFAETKTGDILAATYGSGIFRSSDGGNTWSVSNSGLNESHVSTLLVDSLGTIYAATYATKINNATGGVYRSTDNGATWSLFSTGLASDQIMSLALSSNGDVYSGTLTKGVYRLPAQGASWVATALTAKQINALATSSSAIFAGTNDSGVQLSTNNGTSWVQAGKFPSSSQVTNSLAVSSSGTLLVATNNGILRSVNQGSSWSHNPNPKDKYSTLSVAGPIIYAGTVAGTIYKSTDDGITFTALGNLKSRALIHMVKNTAKGLFAGTNGVIRSTDGGQTWSDLTNGLKVKQTILSVVIDPNGDIYTGSNYSGVFTSKDKGITWQALNNGLDNLNIRTLSWNAQGDLLAGTIQGAAAGNAYRLPKGSTTWVKAKGITGLNQMVSSFAFDANNNILAVGAWNPTVYRSTDGGNNYSKVGSTGSGAGASFAMVKIPSGTLYVGSEGGVEQSSDNGVTWSSIFPKPQNPGDVWGLGFNQLGEILAGRSQIFRYQNSTWTTVSSTVGVPTAFLYNKSGRLFASTSSGVWSSTDNGSSWQSDSTGLAGNPIQSLALDPSGNLYAAAGTLVPYGYLYSWLHYGSGGGLFKTVTSTETVHQAMIQSILTVDTAGPVNTGDTLTYTLSLTNTGDTTAEPVVIQNPIPAQGIYISNSATPVESSNQNNILTWNLPTLLPGETKQLTYKVQVQ